MYKHVKMMTLLYIPKVVQYIVEYSDLVKRRLKCVAFKLRRCVKWRRP